VKPGVTRPAERARQQPFKVRISHSFHHFSKLRTQNSATIKPTNSQNPEVSATTTNTSTLSVIFSAQNKGGSANEQTYKPDNFIETERVAQQTQKYT